MDTTSRPTARRRDDRLTPLLALALLAGLILFLVAAPGTYPVLKTIHILAAVVWVGGLTLIILAILYERRDEMEGLLVVAKQADWVGTRVFVPASLVTLGFGLAAAFKGSWDFGNAWIIIGPRRLGRLGLHRDCPDHAAREAARRGHARPLRGSGRPGRRDRDHADRRIDSVILTLVVADMAAKPFLG